LQIFSLSHGIKIASEFSSTFDKLFHLQSDNLEPSTRILLSIGGSVSAVESLDADKIRAWASKYMIKLFKDNNLTAIVTPTIGISPPILSESAKIKGESNTALVVQTMKYIFLANFVGKSTLLLVSLKKLKY
jgi:hypothetical protein